MRPGDTGGAGEAVNFRGRLDTRDKMSLPRRPGTMADVSPPQFGCFIFKLHYYL